MIERKGRANGRRKPAFGCVSSAEISTGFLAKNGEEFQNWFTDLAGHAYGADFEKIGPHGKYGDFKCDGRRLSTGSIFQCYVPETLVLNRMIGKINSDFNGAIKHWSEFMKVWTFVHNLKKGLPAPASRQMDDLRRDHPGIAIQTWCEPQLLDLFDMLTETAKRTLFGPVPDATTANDVALDDIKPVVEILEKLPLDVGEGSLPIPTVQKLEKNELSDYVKTLLRNGR